MQGLPGKWRDSYAGIVYTGKFQFWADGSWRCDYRIGKTDDRIWLLTPDIGWGCADFKAAYSGRFIDTGIAEQCVVGVSAGLALEGSIPFIIGMMPFMSMRDLEQVRTDLCYQNLPVRIIANYSGVDR